ncbi:family 10 glycosylhydrolase [Kiritimatiellota bacterium B12222]|nr:family 10 glycosylhydrolase [Kiritimatiellota bacterium B12222]
MCVRLLLCCLALFSIGHAGAPKIQTLIDFTTESPRNWQSGEQPARLQQTSGLPEIQLPFKIENRQITLTRVTQFDLSNSTSFRLRMGISHPEVLLEGTLSFKSGNGWYHHPFTLHEKGFHHLLFTQSDFKSEGSPRGWHKIEAIRLSFWPRSTGSTTLTPASLDAFQDTLWLLNPESLATTPDEVYISRVSLRHLDRLLDECGIPHAVLTPAQLTQRTPPSLLIIPYLPTLPQDSYQKLSAFIAKNTRFIVFEGAHQGFANKLGVKLGNSVTSSTMGQFDHLRIHQKNYPYAPEKIYQHAWSFRQLRPLPGSKVTSTWQDAMGRSLKEPGSVENAQAVWLNVAWRSGDVSAKQNLLGEWLGRLDPAQLTESLRFHYETRSPQQFEIRNGSITPQNSQVAQLIELAKRNFINASKENAQPLSAFRAYQKSDELMQRAYAADQSEWKATVRGIWDQNGTGFYAGSWGPTCRILKAAGFNAIFSNMASAGRAHYPSRLIPPSKSLEKHGDQLKAFTTAAHQNGMEAHAWKICWKLNTRLPAFAEKMKREGRLMQDANGKTIPWLSFSHPQNVQFEIDSLLEMARHANIDGIHLDYMRYPGREADYGPAARKAYQSRIGRTLPNWPQEVLGPLKADFQLFRQQELNRAMQQISVAVKKEFPQLQLSVAVWGAWPDCADAQGQDWPVWAKAGWVDWIIPMNYTDNPDQFAGWLDLQMAQPGVTQRLLPGIGLISSNAELTPVQVLHQLDLVAERKLNGAILYRMDSSLESRLFPYLSIWE